MNNLNSILIEGNLVRDPQLRCTPKGTQVANFTIASNRYYKNEASFEKEVSFFDITAWGKLAESTYRVGKKGRSVRVVGRLKQDRWQDPEGKSHAKISIIAEHVEFRPEFAKNMEMEEVREEEAEIESSFDGECHDFEEEVVEEIV